MNKSILGITLLLITQTHTANQKHSQSSAPVNIPGATQTGHNFHRIQTLRRNAHIPNQQPLRIETPFSPLPKCTASAPPLIQPDWHHTRPHPTTKEYDAAYRLRQTPPHLYPDLSDQSDMHPNGDDHILTPVTTLTPPESFFEVPPPTFETLSRTSRDEKEAELLEAYRRQTDFDRLDRESIHTRAESVGLVERSLHTLTVARGRTSPTPSTATIRSAPPQYGVSLCESRSPIVNWVYAKYNAFLATQAETAAEVLRRIKVEEQKIIAAESAGLLTGTNPSTRRRLPSFKSKKALAKDDLLRQQRGRTASIEAASEGMRDVGADLDLYTQSSTVAALQARKEKNPSLSDDELNV